MIQLLTLQNPREMQALADYLKLQGIAVEVQHKNQQVELWLKDVERKADAEQEVKRFLADPYHARYHEASWTRNDTSNVGFGYINQSQYLKTFFAQAGALSIGVFILCWLAYLASLVMGQYAVYAPMLYPIFKVQMLEAPWRVFTPVFIHFSLMHIAFNTMWWWQLGGQIEQVLGKARLLIILVASGLFSNYMQAQFSEPNLHWEGFTFGGLSGVVYALVGYCWTVGKLQPSTGINLPKPIAIMMLVWMAIGFADVLYIHMANAAHLTGLLTGVALAGVFHTRDIKK